MFGLSKRKKPQEKAKKKSLESTKGTQSKARLRLMRKKKKNGNNQSSHRKNGVRPEKNGVLKASNAGTDPSHQKVP